MSAETSSAAPAAVFRDPVSTISTESGLQDEAPGLTLAWLIKLRWAALFGQLVLVGLALRGGWLPAPRAALAFVAAGLASNLALLLLPATSHARNSRHLIGGMLILDIVLLTGLLAVTGGPANPFTVVYLVYVTLASVTLGTAWSWTIVLSAIGGYATLFFWQLPLPEHVMHEGRLPSHLAGMWLAFGATASIIALFVTALTRTLARRERELADVRRMAARSERLASLMTLAAGAAHELATPLASIAVAARELERTGDAVIRDDAGLIRSQVERCRSILDQMSGRANEAWVEPPTDTSVDDLLAGVVEGLEPERRTRLRITHPTGLALVVSRPGLIQALLNLVRNAFDASPPDALVSIDVTPRDLDIEFSVRDQGTGMAPEILERSGEPFFTTKPPGAGFGLGLFLVRSFAERHGGRLTLTSRPGQGTTARLALKARQRS